MVWGAGRASVRLSIGAAGSLPPCDAPAFHAWRAPCGSLRASFHEAACGYRIRFPRVAEFDLSRDGLRVRAQGAASLNAPDLVHLFWKDVFPLAASLQGLAVLHAGAVEVAGCAVALLGPSGAGKSTLTAALAGAGCRFLTDDALALVMEPGQAPLAVPGPASIRLWQDSLDQLAPGESRAAAMAVTEKARLAAGSPFLHCGAERPLACIYLLGDGSAQAPCIEAVRPAQAMFELASSAFLIDPGDPELLARQFALLSQMASHAPVFRFDYPRRFDALRPVCEAIVRHAAHLVTRAPESTR